MMLSDWPGADLSLSRSTLRFYSAQQEMDFVRARKSKLTTNLFWSAAVAVPIGAGLMLQLGLTDKGHFHSEAALLHGKVQLTCIGIAVAMGLLTMAATKTRPLIQATDPVVLECLATADVTLAMCICVLGRVNYYVAKMTGHAPELVWGQGTHFSDCTVILLILGFVMTSHQVLPVRWCIMMTMEVIGVMLYAALVALGSPDPLAPLSLVLLAGIITATAMGMRAVELGERRAFSRSSERKTRP